MKKVIEEMVTVEGKPIMRITTADERWYVKGEKTFVPSVTWIAGYYPKGIGFYKWLADKGWDEAEAIKNAAGDKGSKVHYAITDLLKGGKVAIDGQYPNPTTGEPEEITKEEYECIMSFVGWFNETKPKVIANEVVVFSEGDKYAGTIDLICKIDKQVWVIDFKTGQTVWPEYELQISAYKHGLKKPGIVKLGILQLGYQRNKNKYKFTEVEDKFELFKAAYRIWHNENDGVEPKVRDYPMTLKLNLETKKKVLLTKTKKVNKKGGKK